MPPLCGHVSDDLTVLLVPFPLRVVWLAQDGQAMPSTACYYAANRGDNPCKPVTDSLIPIHGLRVGSRWFFVCLFAWFLFLKFVLIQPAFCEL